MDPTELKFSRDLAIMVYHYMLEWRMENLAQVFAANCPILSHGARHPEHGLLSVIPYRRLHDAMFEYSKLLESMRRTIQDHHMEVPIPFGGTTWDKVKFVIDHFHAKSKARATEATTDEASDTGVVYATQAPSSTTVDGADVGTENLYQLLEVNQPGAVSHLSVVPDNHHPPTDPCTSNTEEQSATETPMVLFVQNGERQELGNGTFFVPMNQLQLSEEMPSTAPISFLTLDDGVVIRQQIESNPVLPEQTNQNPAEQSLPSLPILEDDAISMEFEKPIILPASEDDASVKEEPEIVSTEPDNRSSEAPTLAPPHPNLAVLDVMSLAENGQAAEQPVQAGNEEDVQVSDWEDLLEPLIMAEPVQPSPGLSNQPAKKKPRTKKPIDLEALAQWNQSRNIDSSNWDNHIRQLNYADEQKKEKVLLAARKKKQTPTKQKATVGKKEKTIRTVVKPASPASTTGKHKQKRGRPKKGGKLCTPPNTRLAASERKQQPLDDSDSSEFASSPGEDADVRKMYESVKQYRKQKKKIAAKENLLEELAAQRNVASSAFLPLCRLNLIVGRTPPKSTVKRSLRKRTHSTSPPGTPDKCANKTPTVPGNTTVPSTSSSTGRRIGLAKSAKKPKQTEQQSAAAKLTTTGDALSQPALAPLSPKNRRPVRACTMNRKMKFTASTPLKVSAPNGENMPPSGTLGSPEPIEENASADTVDAGEAAIYAVLAQLHGDC